MFDRNQFNNQKQKNINAAFEDKELQDLAVKFITKSDQHNYAYNWTWLGLPVIQMPEDIVLIQEIIADVKPDIILETGIAWGGSIVLYASILELLGKGKAIGIDVVLPQKNIDQIMNYSFSKRIHLIEGSSTDQSVLAQVQDLITPSDKVMVILDSNHTHEHVFNELQLYKKFVSKDSYLVVSDTIVEEIPVQLHRPRPWGHGNNPRTAVDLFLKEENNFSRDNDYNRKAINSFTRNGYLKRV
jgi:cephalosporin hydroxylase